jgi:hypothetical protein
MLLGLLAALLRPWRLLVVVEIRGAWWAAVRMGGRFYGSMSSRMGMESCIVTSRLVVGVPIVSMIDAGVFQNTLTLKIT